MKIVKKIAFLVGGTILGNCAFAMEFTAEQLNDKEIAKGLFLDFKKTVGGN